MTASFAEWEPTPDPEQLAASRALLHELVDRCPGSLVIGGWAVSAYTGRAHTHDVDIVIPVEHLAGLRRTEEDLSTSTHVGGVKYHLGRGRTHADIYVPYQSHLGARLRLPVERLLEHPAVADGIPVPTREALLTAKAAGALDRPRTVPGWKDRADLAALILLGEPPRWDQVAAILAPSRGPSPNRRELVRDALASVAGSEPADGPRRATLLRRIAEGRRVLLAVQLRQAADRGRGGVA